MSIRRKCLATLFLTVGLLTALGWKQYGVGEEAFMRELGYVLGTHADRYLQVSLSSGGPSDCSEQVLSDYIKSVATPRAFYEDERGFQVYGMVSLCPSRDRSRGRQHLIAGDAKGVPEQWYLIALETMKNLDEGCLEPRFHVQATDDEEFAFFAQDRCFGSSQQGVLDEDRVAMAEVIIFASIDWVHARSAALLTELMTYFGAFALVLFLSQLAVLQWVLRPIQTMATRIAAVHMGRDRDIGRGYPKELQPLVDSVERLVSDAEDWKDRSRDVTTKALEDAAHSIRNRLGVMRLVLETAELDPRSYRRIMVAGEPVDRWIRDSLEGAIVDRPLLPWEFTEVGEEMLREVWSACALTLKTYGTRKYNWKCAPDVKVQAERDDILKVLEALVDNAIKYGKSQVFVRVDEEERKARIAVEDDGHGILEAEKSRLVKRRHRGNGREDGHGIGLSYATSKVNGVGGDLKIEDSEKFGGARIVINLPSLGGRTG